MSREISKDASIFLERVGMKRWGWLPREAQIMLRDGCAKGVSTEVQLRDIGNNLSRLEPFKETVLHGLIPVVMKKHAIGSTREAVEMLLEYTKSPNALASFLGKRVTVSLAFYGDTHIGRRKSNNQDAFIANSPKKLFAVADGVGGRQKGEVASRNAVDFVCTRFNLANPNSLEEAIHAANEHVKRKGQEEGVKMATTFTALHVSEYGKAHIAHVGDSRLYIYRNGKLQQLTIDHNLPDNPSHVTQAIGVSEHLQPFVSTVKVASGDYFLVCSDGLTRHLTDEDIRNEIERGEKGKQNLKQIVDGFISKANERGGQDNITAVLVHARYTIA